MYFTNHCHDMNDHFTFVPVNWMEGRIFLACLRVDPRNIVSFNIFVSLLS